MIRPIVYANGDLVIGFHRLFDLVGEGEDIVGPIISDDRCREFGSVGEFLGGGAEGGEEFFDEGDFELGLESIDGFQSGFVGGTEGLG